MRSEAVAAAPVVGRAQERHVLSAALDRAREGTGGVVLVTGPAGIGKTRVLEVLADDAHAAAVPVRWGRCLEHQGAPPLWPWRRVIGGAGGSVPVDATLEQVTAATPEDTAVARLTLMASVVDALVAAAEPAGLVVVLEDLHWADAASLALLRHLADDVRRTRLLVAVSSRDVAAGPVAHALADLVPLPGVEVLEVGALGVAGVAAYLYAAAGPAVDPAGVALVHERSGGNPLYMRTLARVLGPALLRDLPMDGELTRLLSQSTELRHLIAAVLRPLTAPVRHLLEVASLLGEEVDPGLLAAVAGLAAADVEHLLDEAADAGLLVVVPDAPGRRRFAHALVRDGVQAGVAGADRRRWHVRAATELEPLVADQPHRGAEVAVHWSQGAVSAQELRRTVHWARLAAAQAGSLDPEQAVRLLTSAVSASESAGGDLVERAELLVELAGADYRAGRMTASLEHSRLASDAAELAGRPDLMAAAALVLRGIGHEAIAALLLELCERALGAAGHPPATVARLGAQHALALAELGRREPARAEAVAALQAAEACGDPQAVLVAVHACVDTLDATGDPGERRALAMRALQVAPAAGQPQARLWARLWLLDAAYQAGDPAQVDEQIQHIGALVATSRSPLARWHLLRVQAARAALAGQLEQARTANSAAGALAAQLQDRSAVGMTDAFRLCLATLTGDPAELGDGWLAALADAPDIPILDACRASALLLMGRPDQAQLFYRRVLPQVDRLPRDGRWRGTLDAVVEVAEALGDAHAAELLYDVLLPAGPWTGGPGAGNMWTTGSGWRQVGRVAVLAGRREDGLLAFEKAFDESLADIGR